MKTFGLTGGIGTGKSTVARMLRERHGVPVVDADQVARDVVAPGSDGLAEVVEAFGEQVLADDGALDRAAMRRRVMADASARTRLEAITHPRIFAGIAEQLQRWATAGEPLAGVEAALMVETGSYRMYDALVVVTCSPDTQRARVMARDDATAEEVQRILDAQLPLADKEAVATHLVRNDGSLQDLTAAVDTLYEALSAEPSEG